MNREAGQIALIIRKNEENFAETGLKQDSLIRISRLAVIEENLLLGAIGKLENSRLKEIKTRVSKWITDSL